MNFLLKPKITKTVLRFIFVGVLNTIVGYSFYSFFIYLNRHYSLASLASQVIGTIHSYFWNKYFTFKSQGYSLSEISRFLLVYLASYLINLFFLFILIDLLSANKFLAGLITLLITTLISFFGHRYFSFKKNTEIK